MKRYRTISVVIVLALLPVWMFFWRGYIEVYRRIPDADVRVNGLLAGYAHRGPVSTIVTRTDLPSPHSYRVWPTAIDAYIFDCHQWVAPKGKYFLQGRISSPCIFATSGAGSFEPTAPNSRGITEQGVLRFTTRDGKAITMRAPY